MLGLLKYLLIPVAVLSLIGAVLLNIPAVQDLLLNRMVTLAAGSRGDTVPFDGLRVFMCGTSSPLPAPDRVQACIAVQTGERLYLIDAGAGSARTLNLARINLAQLDAVLLTHFHSDHIASLGDFNLNSWVAGRPQPLSVFGPTGVARVVAGFNEAYALDSSYRVAHHGADLLPPDLAVMQARSIEPGVIVERGDLIIRAFATDHAPIHPTLGYRFDYRGRSVVISGDTLVSDGLLEAARGADVLLQDALSLPIVGAMEHAMQGTRMEKILADIQDYHAPTEDMTQLLNATDVGLLALYHLVPPPPNFLFEKIFTRDLPSGTLLTEDGMIIDLPAGSDDINVY